MNRFLAPSALAFSLLALAVALSFRTPSSPQPEEVEPESRPAAASAGESSEDLEERLTSLELTASSLVRRVEALERAGAPKPGATAAVPVPEEDRRQLAALRSDVDALLTGEALASDTGRQRFKELLRTVQDEVRAERTREREASRERARSEQFKRFAAEARLSSTQEQDLGRLLDEESGQRRALRERPPPAEGGPRARREELRALTERTNEAARRILDAEQYEKFGALRQDGRRGGGGRPRPGPEAGPRH